MSNYIETSTKGFAASGAIAQYLRVILSGTQLSVAGVGDIEVGTIEQAAFNAGDMRAVRLRSAQGTTPMVASGAISLFAPVYGDAGGKISATPNGNFIGIALKAASGNNSVIEVLRIDTNAAVTGNVVVEAHTANYTVLTSDAGKILTNTAAAGEVDFALPAATVGLAYQFGLTVAQTVKILPNGTDQIGTLSTSTVPATGVLNTAGHGFSAAAIGATAWLACLKAGQWDVISSAGNWTAL
jgi:hypothetical protein